jgi:serine/threonine protein kinase
MVDYRIIRKLGEGSFGEVMLGEKNNNEYVAIKKISKEQIIKVLFTLS